MKLYLGNLPYDSTEIDLREFLAPYEPIVDLHVPLDRDTGNPRGFAFVTLSSREVGEKALEELDGAEFNGRAMRAREAEDRPRGGGGGGGGYRGGGGGGGHGGGGGGGGRRDYNDRGDRGGGRRDSRGPDSGKRYRSL